MRRSDHHRSSPGFPYRRGVNGARALAIWLCAVLALTLTAAANARAGAVYATTASAAALPAGGGIPFAIADFDGDQRPDMARVQAGQTHSSQTQYWIQLQLTRAGRQLIGVVAPIGGLQVTASDVNGDHAIDLVLSTAWLGRPVAILLNDGHGQFTAEKPSAFPDAFRQAASERISHMRHPRGAASAAQLRPGVDTDARLAQPLPKIRGGLHSGLAIRASIAQLSQQDRAPPSQPITPS